MGIYERQSTWCDTWGCVTSWRLDPPNGNFPWIFMVVMRTGWWFGTIFYFSIYTGNSNPNWLIFFRGVETTNQIMIQWNWGTWIFMEKHSKFGGWHHGFPDWSPYNFVALSTEIHREIKRDINREMQRERNREINKLGINREIKKDMNYEIK